MVMCVCLLALLVFSQGVKGDHGDPIPPSGDSDFQSRKTTPLDSHSILSDQASKDFDFGLTTTTILRQNYGALFIKQPKILLNGISKFCLYFKIPRIQLPNFTALNQTIRNCRSNSGLSCDWIQVLDGIFRNLYGHLRDQARINNRIINPFLSDPMTPASVRRLYKRGAFNFIGTIQKKLFGLSTESDIRHCFAHIQSLEKFVVESNKDVASLHTHFSGFANITNQRFSTLNARINQTFHGFKDVVRTLSDVQCYQKTLDFTVDDLCT